MNKDKGQNVSYKLEKDFFFFLKGIKDMERQRHSRSLGSFYRRLFHFSFTIARGTVRRAMNSAGKKR